MKAERGMEEDPARAIVNRGFPPSAQPDMSRNKNVYRNPVPDRPVFRGDNYFWDSQKQNSVNRFTSDQDYKMQRSMSTGGGGLPPAAPLGVHVSKRSASSERGPNLMAPEYRYGIALERKISAPIWSMRPPNSGLQPQYRQGQASTPPFPKKEPPLNVAWSPQIGNGLRLGEHLPLGSRNGSKRQQSRYSPMMGQRYNTSPPERVRRLSGGVDTWKEKVNPAFEAGSNAAPWQPMHSHPSYAPPRENELSRPPMQPYRQIQPAQQWQGPEVGDTLNLQKSSR